MIYFLIYLLFVILILNKYRMLQERELESQTETNLGLIKRANRLDELLHKQNIATLEKALENEQYNQQG